MLHFNLQEKIREKCSFLPYRITDTGGLVEKTKAIGRKMIKELGNKSGRNLWEMPYLVLRTRNLKFQIANRKSDRSHPER